jgi:hypothetical protein
MILSERVSKIQGFEPVEFVAYVLLSDALSDLAENEFPDLAGQIADQEQDVVSSLKKIVKKKKLKIEDYLDLVTAKKLVKELDSKWEGKIDFNDFLNFDQDASVKLILQMAGNTIDVEEDPKVAKFLKSNSVSLPEDPVAVSQKVFQKAYELADALLLTESRDASKVVMETVEYERSRLKQDAIRVLSELQRRYYAKDRELDRMIGYLEYLK